MKRGKKYLEALNKIEKGKLYTKEEAVKYQGSNDTFFEEWNHQLFNASQLYGYIQNRIEYLKYLIECSQTNL